MTHCLFKDKFKVLVLVLDTQVLVLVLEEKSFVVSLFLVGTVREAQYMRHHLFADDMQGFRSGDPSDISVIVTGVEDCVSDVSSWSAAKRLLH